MLIPHPIHVSKPVDKNNYFTETKTQLFSHHTMQEESFKVDAFNLMDNTGILGRMNDILGNSMAIGQIAIDKTSVNLMGDPSLPRQVDVVRRSGVDEFYRQNVPGSSDESKRAVLRPLMRQLNSIADDTSGVHSNVWSQSFIDSQNKTETYRTLLANVNKTTAVPRNTALGVQIDMIVQLIKSREERGVNRDSFAVTMGGFDQVRLCQCWLSRGTSPGSNRSVSLHSTLA
jgi:hypothetical protein